LQASNEYLTIYNLTKRLNEKHFLEIPATSLVFWEALSKVKINWRIKIKMRNFTVLNDRKGRQDLDEN